MSDKQLVLFWFRDDLRLTDNPALHAAAQASTVLPIYIYDTTRRLLGGAAQWWLHHSLNALQEKLPDLCLLKGDPQKIIPQLVKQHSLNAVYWNRRYDRESVTTDKALKEKLSTETITVHSYKGNLLLEPWEVKTQSGEHYKVFTSFWRAVQESCTFTEHLPASEVISTCTHGGDTLDEWQLLPTKPNWAKGFEDAWHPGEDGAHTQLKHFIDNSLEGYKELRNRPDLDHVSRLSPHLRFGEVSPRYVYWAAENARNNANSKDVDCFHSELGWREFSYNLIYHYPKLDNENLKSAFNAYPWEKNDNALLAWQRGCTGYPMVDAGMRQLWATGWMHNRVRMIVASFLIKHLRIDWRVGEEWFWDTLVDADVANNPASWQWVAGSGADAAPYFRIFNPITQGEKFDPKGDYIRAWVPELAKLENAYIHTPWKASKDALKKAGAEHYPAPIVDHTTARDKAMEGYEHVKNSSSK